MRPGSLRTVAAVFLLGADTLAAQTAPQEVTTTNPLAILEFLKGETAIEVRICDLR
jgi:hypothetical protein